MRRNDLRQARLALGLTQTQLAEAIGQDQSAVSKYELGKQGISLGLAPIVAKVLRIPVLQVLYGSRLDSEAA